METTGFFTAVFAFLAAGTEVVFLGVAGCATVLAVVVEVLSLQVRFTKTFLLSLLGYSNGGSGGFCNDFPVSYFYASNPQLNIISTQIYHGMK